MSDINKITRGEWVACVSVPCMCSDEDDICTAIKDKGNGNVTPANDIDEDYLRLMLATPKMYRALESVLQLGVDEVQASIINEALSSARGES